MSPDGGDASERPNQGEDHETEEVVDSGTMMYVIEEDINQVSKHVDPKAYAAVADKTDKMASHQTAQDQDQAETARLKANPSHSQPVPKDEAENQVLAAEAQHIPPMQQALVAEDSGLAPQAQCVPHTQQVLVAEDRAQAEQDAAQPAPN